MKNPTQKVINTRKHTARICVWLGPGLSLVRGAACFGQNNHCKKKNNTNFGDSHKTVFEQPNKSGTPDPKRRSDDVLVDAACLNLPAILDHETFAKRC